MTGSDLIRILRAQKVEIPIVMISGNPEVRKEAEEAGRRRVRREESRHDVHSESHPGASGD